MVPIAKGAVGANGEGAGCGKKFKEEDKGIYREWGSDQLFFKRPIRIEEIIDERGRDDADCLVDLRDSAGIGDA